MDTFPKILVATVEDAGKRLDQFLVSQIVDTSRARVQQLINEEKVLVNDDPAKASLRLRGGERIAILGAVKSPPLRAMAEEIPLDIVYEDDDLAVVNKAAGMMVHAGAGATEDERNRGTLANALLHRFGELSGVGGRVAARDCAPSGQGHKRADRGCQKRRGSSEAGGSVRRARSQENVYRVGTRMGQAGSGNHQQPHQPRPGAADPHDYQAFRRREATTHYTVQKRIDSKYGKFTLLKLGIDTGRTHQIRVHLASLRHPVVGDTLYGAPREMSTKNEAGISLPRNFLHSTALQLQHPRSGVALSFERPLPEELQGFINKIEAS